MFSGSPGEPGLGTDGISVVLVEDDPLGGQSVEVGCLDPAIAVRAQESQVQAVADDDDDVHGPILTPDGAGVSLQDGG